jgi:endonuclease YncB( thermonuclease family)
MLRICSLIVSFGLGTILGAMPGTLSGAVAQEITGTIRVVDGDTFRLGRADIRLHAVDAPETDTPCLDREGRLWDCGRWSAARLAETFEGASARCRQVDVDRYGRIVARCTARGVDIGEHIVGEGWAWAWRRFGMDYDLTEKAAATQGLGLWARSGESHDAYRARDTARTPGPALAAAAPGGCVIKGNISGNGRIYHLPGQEHYDRTGIDEARGERWFCTEAEAQAAGWRRARR